MDPYLALLTVLEEVGDTVPPLAEVLFDENGAMIEYTEGSLEAYWMLNGNTGYMPKINAGIWHIWRGAPFTKEQWVAIRQRSIRFYNGSYLLE